MENKKKKKMLCFYNADRVEPLFSVIEDYKRKMFIEENKMPTFDDIAINVFLPALKEKL